MRIAYLFNSYLCCGGNRIAFEHLNRLATRGHECCAVDLTGRHDPSWFRFNDRVRLVRYLDYDAWLPGLDAASATYFRTVPDVLRLPDCVKKFYFVQTDERNFHEKGSRGELECENTYRHPVLHLFTEASWVKEWLARDFGREALLVENGLNFDDFYPDPDPGLRSDRPVVLVEGNAAAVKKGVRDATAAIEGLNVEKWLLCNDDQGLPEYTQAFDRIFNLPPQPTVRKIISSADVMLKPSHFEGCPLPHMEAMVCRTALVTTDCTGASEHCRDGENALIVPVADADAMRRAVERLLGDDALRRRQIENAFAYAQQRFRWDAKIDVLEKMLRDRKPVDSRSIRPGSLPDPLPTSVLEEEHEVVLPPPDFEAGVSREESELMRTVLSKVVGLKQTLGEEGRGIERLSQRVAELDERLSRKDEIAEALDREREQAQQRFHQRLVLLEDRLSRRDTIADVLDTLDALGRRVERLESGHERLGEMSREGLEELRRCELDNRTEIVSILAYHRKFVRVARWLGLDRALRCRRWVTRSLARRTLRAEQVTPELVAGDRISQDFVADRPFERLSVRLATHARANGCRLRLALFAPARGKEPLHQLEVDGRSIPDNQPMTISFPRVSPEGSERYRLCIESPDASAGQGISAYARPPVGRGESFRFNRTRFRGMIDVSVIPAG